MQIPPCDNGIISKSGMFIKLSKLSYMDVLAYRQSRLLGKRTYAWLRREWLGGIQMCQPRWDAISNALLAKHISSRRCQKMHSPAIVCGGVLFPFSGNLENFGVYRGQKCLTVLKRKKKNNRPESSCFVGNMIEMELSHIVILLVFFFLCCGCVMVLLSGHKVLNECHMFHSHTPTLS